MLLKLFKYEIKQNIRSFMSLYGIYLASIFLFMLVGGSKFGFENDDNILLVFIMIVIIITLVAIFLGTFITICRNYYRSLYKDESALTMTLPVTTNQLITSKLLAAGFWSFLSVFVFAISLGILLLMGPSINFSQFGVIWDLIDKSNVLLAFLYAVVGLFYLFLNVFFCLTITQTNYVQKNRLILSFACCFVLNIVISYVSSFFIGNLTSYQGNISAEIIKNSALAIIFYLGIKYVLDKKIEVQ